MFAWGMLANTQILGRGWEGHDSEYKNLVQVSFCTEACPVFGFLFVSRFFFQGVGDTLVFLNFILF